MTELAGVELDNWDRLTASLELPIAIEDITPAFLSAALSHRFAGTVVDDFRIVFTRHGFTTILRLDLDLDEKSKAAGVPSRIILKGGFEPATRGRAKDFAIAPFLMEVAAYREMKPALGLHMPDCYFAEVDVERRQMILLMEDLALRNVRFGSGLVPHTAAQVRQRLSSLAAFHARSWGDPELKKPDGRWKMFPGNGAGMFFDYMHHVGYAEKSEWQKYVDMPRGAASSAEFHDVDWVLHSLKYMDALSKALPNCVVHGDTHAGNLFEEPDGTPGFFDSLPSRAAPMIEIAYCITNVMDCAERRRNDKALIAHYRDELSRHSVAVPSLDEMLRQFAAFLPYGYVTFMVNENTYQTESFNTAHTARYSAAMLDHDTKKVIADGFIPS